MVRKENLGDTAKDDMGAAGRDQSEAGDLPMGKKHEISVKPVCGSRRSGG